MQMDERKIIIYKSKWSQNKYVRIRSVIQLHEHVFAWKVKVAKLFLYCAFVCDWNTIGNRSIPMCNWSITCRINIYPIKTAYTFISKQKLVAKIQFLIDYSRWIVWPIFNELNKIESVVICLGRNEWFRTQVSIDTSSARIWNAVSRQWRHENIWNSNTMANYWQKWSFHWHWLSFSYRNTLLLQLMTNAMPMIHSFHLDR